MLTASTTPTSSGRVLRAPWLRKAKTWLIRQAAEAASACQRGQGAALPYSESLSPKVVPHLYSATFLKNPEEVKESNKVTVEDSTVWDIRLDRGYGLCSNQRCSVEHCTQTSPGPAFVPGTP